jgi:hypothetical protein
MELEKSLGPDEPDDKGTKANNADGSLAPRLESSEPCESRGNGAVRGLTVAGAVAAVILGAYLAYKGFCCVANSEAVQRTIWQAEESIKKYGR